ncbi:MAG: hypothetical protein WCT50_04980 [Patescibacteria group bacterium]
MFKPIKRYFQKRFDRFYRVNRWHLVLDISLMIILLSLVVLLIKLNLNQPNFDISTWTAQKKVYVDLDNPFLEVNFNTQSEAIRLEDGLPIVLHLKNNGQVNVNDLKFNLVLNNNDFLISKIETSSAYETDKNTLKIEGVKLSVANVPAASEISINLKVYFKERVKGAKLINWQADSEYYFDNQLFKNTVVLDDIKVASKVNVQAAGYYNSPQGDQLGSGPLPPIVGLPTNFWIFLKAEPAGDFGEFVVSAKLPKNISFTNNTSMLAGNLNYSSSSRQVIWQVDSLQEDGNDYRVGFEVQLIPTKEQIGKEAPLLNSIKFKALDIFSNLRIEGNVSSLDTALEHDTINAGEGRVATE